MKDMVWTNLRFSLLMYRLIKRFSFEKMSMVFKYKTLIANVLVRTPVCKPTASPGSQEKMCRAGFLQLLITNVLDRTPVCKVRAMVFPLKSRENLQRRISASLQRKRLFCMTRVQPRINNWVRFAYLSFWVCCHLSNWKDWHLFI